MPTRKEPRTRRTKIVCTLGPATSSEEVIRELIRSGMDIARINASHGTWAEHAAYISFVRRLAQEEGRVVAILLDLQGPRVRVGAVQPEPVTLNPGQTLVLTSRSVVGNSQEVSVVPPGLISDLRVGVRVMIADGQIELVVTGVSTTDARCEVVVGGELSSHKGINVPGVTLNVPGLTEKDLADLAFGVRQEVDFVGLSFVRSADDVREAKRRLAELGSGAQVVAKIEKHEAVAAFDEILAAADGVMVARGDLGVETSVEEVPIIQKMVIRKCNQAGKPVITATQMLNSMIESPRPTRAEASDVANAIFDGSDAVMLSGETAVGKYPLQAVRMMAEIASRADEALPYDEWLRRAAEEKARNVTEAISQATVEVACELEAKAIVTFTESGHTARDVARHRPRVPIVATTTSSLTQRHLALTWGVQSFLIPEQTNTDEMMRLSVEAASQAIALSQGDLLVLTAGVPRSGAGRTNLLRVHTVGEGTSP